MKAFNSKSLLEFIFIQMEKLDKNQINTEKAREQANLCKQANNVLKYEIDRAKVLMDISRHNKQFADNISLRDIEKSE